jgi:hypothetical protein
MILSTAVNLLGSGLVTYKLAIFFVPALYIYPDVFHSQRRALLLQRRPAKAAALENLSFLYLIAMCTSCIDLIAVKNEEGELWSEGEACAYI